MAGYGRIPEEDSQMQFEMEQKAREEGREAAREGLGLQDNPYFEEPYKSAWVEGWWAEQ